MKKILTLACSLVTFVKDERVTVEPGTVIPLPDKKYGLEKEDVERIVNAGGGTVSEPEAKVVEEPEDKGIVLTNDRLIQLTQAIDKLEKDNDKHWTNKNEPEIAALKEITGGKVSAAERDAAWAAYQAQ